MPRALLVCLLLLAATPVAMAARVTGLYEATVPLAERSERAQSDALQAALRQVLVRLTGRRDAGEEAALAPIVNEARRYVQQFRVVGGNQFFAGFDGARLERAIVEAGQPLWGIERPGTLVVLVDDVARRVVRSGDPAPDLMKAFERAAGLRGLPLIWPDSARPIEYSAATSASPELLQSLGTSHGADAVLLGRAVGSSSAGWQVRWTLVQAGESSQWRGSLEEGAHGVADAYVRNFAAAPVTEGSDVAITVTGIGTLQAYARVTEYLESFSLVRSLAVDELSGDTVVYRARVQGGSERLARAIDLGGRLERVEDPIGAALAYRLRP